MNEITVKAVPESTPEVMAFIEEELNRQDCPMRIQMQINVAVDEIFSNIVMYAYPQKDGVATVRLETTEDPKAFVVTFTDSGIPYNPLAKKDPDVTLAAEDRPIGGLGIFMAKKLTDGMNYAYEHGQNVLQIRKLLPG